MFKEITPSYTYALWFVRVSIILCRFSGNLHIL